MCDSNYSVPSEVDRLGRVDAPSQSTPASSATHRGADMHARVSLHINHGMHKHNFRNKARVGGPHSETRKVAPTMHMAPPCTSS